MFAGDPIVRAIAMLPPVSDAAAKLLALASSVNADLVRAAELVSSDPALLANALRLANTAGYAGNDRVSDATSAIRRFGIEGLRELASTMVFLSAYPGRRENRMVGYDITQAQFVRHSVAVGVFARRLATLSCPDEVGHAYAAGLLHDIGKLVIDVVLRTNPTLLQQLGGRPLVEVERELLGYDHAEVGARLAFYWRFPSPIVQAIPVHHDPSHASNRLGGVVAVANALAHWYGYGAGNHQSFSTRMLDPRAFKALGLDAAAVEKCAIAALDRVRASATVFNRAA